MSKLALSLMLSTLAGMITPPKVNFNRAVPTRTRIRRDKSSEPYGSKLARIAMRRRLGLRHP